MAALLLAVALAAALLAGALLAGALLVAGLLLALVLALLQPARNAAATAPATQTRAAQTRAAHGTLHPPAVMPAACKTPVPAASPAPGEGKRDPAEVAASARRPATSSAARAGRGTPSR
jgi:hypothetical protein